MSNYKPLAEIMRPTSLNDFIGQEHLLGNNGPIAVNLKNNSLQSMILWGPPGSGKTTLARIICNYIDANIEQMSATLDGVKELRAILQRSKLHLKNNKKTVLFVDEIHRLNKSQQDAFLPHIESSLITLIGATTENPSFEINIALLSRVNVYILKKLNTKQLKIIANRIIKNKKLIFKDENLLNDIIKTSAGDARRLINIIEHISHINKNEIDSKDVEKILQEKINLFDKGGDIYYQQLSAFHKAVRGSSPDAALYWMARMLISGCSPKIIARRLLAIASEDIGNADPRALQITINAWDIYERVGDKEGNRAIAQAAVFCACAPKSNALYKAFNKAITAAENTATLEVPKHLCNAPNKFMQNLEYGKNYNYSHNEADGVSVGQKYFPDKMGEQIYYEPVDRGLEIKIKEKLKQLRKNI